jgi:dTDP-4-dehydrorhamnose 3,5-epimerase
MYPIDGVIIKELVTHSDERGFFREIIRATDDIFDTDFGQFSHSLVFAGEVKAWHGHKFQTQWTYVGTGDLRVALHDTRLRSSTFQKTMEFIVGEHSKPCVYVFPPGVVHGYKVINGPANVFYITSGQYDSEDEVRIPHDDSEINYDWFETSIK